MLTKAGPIVRRSTQGAIPSEIGDLIDTIDDILDRLRTLEAPSGEALANVIDRTILPVPVYILEGDATIPSAIGPVVSTTVAVPAGYTRAIVQATADIVVKSNQSTGWALLNGACRVTPDGGQPSYVQWSSVDAQRYGNAVASSSVVLSGLTAGEVITIEALASFAPAYTFARAAIVGTVLFTR